MSFYVAYKCQDCEDFSPAIKALCNPEGEHFNNWVLNLGKWIYKHTECIIYSQDEGFTVISELNEEFEKSPMDWQ